MAASSCALGESACVRSAREFRTYSGLIQERILAALDVRLMTALQVLQVHNHSTLARKNRSEQKESPHAHEQDFGRTIRGTGGSPAPDKGQTATGWQRGPRCSVDSQLRGWLFSRRAAAAAGRRCRLPSPPTFWDPPGQKLGNRVSPSESPTSAASCPAWPWRLGDRCFVCQLAAWLGERFLAIQYQTTLTPTSSFCQLGGWA